jgi:hypothetical protein
VSATTNEVVWLTTTNPQKMLEILEHTPAPVAEFERYFTNPQWRSKYLEMTHGQLPSLWEMNPRKRWLFACLCCRRFWNLLRYKPSRTAVEYAEQLAEDRRLPGERLPESEELQRGGSAPTPPTTRCCGRSPSLAGPGSRSGDSRLRVR